MKTHLLRKVFLLLLVNCSLLIAKGQWVTIPDPNFVTFLQQSYPSCMNGNLMDTTCLSIVNDTSVDCNTKNISDLTGIQYFDNLRNLDCSSNQLTVLPTLPGSLTYLSCYNNFITSLPTLPLGLAWLDCGVNYLTSLPPLPGALVFFNCNVNQITALPALPASLTEVFCDGNQISSLPVLPAGLLRLWCYQNQLTSLPVLPVNLTELQCYSNQLTSLPTLPESLIDLGCDDNLLSSIPELPDSLHYFDCSSNPDLFCLPKLKIVQNFTFSFTGIACLPNYPQGNTYSSPTLASIPLCDSTNINSCAYCHAYFSVYPDSGNTGIYYGYNQSYGSNLTSYLWEFGDGATSTLQYPSHTYATPGQYYVCLTAGGADCTNTFCDSSFLVFKTEGGLMSQLIIVDPNGPSAIEEAESNSVNIVYPNPATNQLTINLGGLQAEQVSIYNVNGILVSAIKRPTNNNIDINELANGVYIAEINLGGAVQRVRWVKM